MEGAGLLFKGLPQFFSKIFHGKGFANKGEALLQ
jgi:hypothetical protein